MHFTLATIALTAASVVSAQGVASGITPPTSAPAGCVSDYSSKFEITVVLPGKKRDVNHSLQSRAACGGDGTLVAELKGGVLTDAKGRIGAIVANGQFQFDGPPAQTGSIYTGGWSVCQDGALALGDTKTFQQCLSGTFYNLYYKNDAAQCSAVEIYVIPCGSGGAGEGQDGQVTATSAGAHITQIGDGQIQATSAGAYVTQIGDGQIQVTSAGAKPTGAPVSQINDGQIQASSAVSKPAMAPVSQYTDGQLQVTAMPTYTIPAVVPTTTAAPVSQISDGQLQAPTTIKTVAPIVTQAPAGNQTTTASSPAFTGAAAAINLGYNFVAGAVALAGLALL